VDQGWIYLANKFAPSQCGSDPSEGLQPLERLKCEYRVGYLHIHQSIRELPFSRHHDMGFPPGFWQTRKQAEQAFTAPTQFCKFLAAGLRTIVDE
jgi:hypothetical protein